MKKGDNREKLILGPEKRIHLGSGPGQVAVVQGRTRSGCGAEDTTSPETVRYFSSIIFTVEAILRSLTRECAVI